MSLGIYPVFESKLQGAKFEALGEVLARNYQSLDRIARAAKLKPFTSFGDNREVPDDFEGPPEELEAVLGPCNEWFDPTDGRTAIQALANHIKTNKRAAKKLDEPAGVIEELEELARILAVAENEAVRFRLEMS
jgi:hypothetical protein